MVRQRLAPREQAIGTRMRDEVRIALDQRDCALAARNLEHPQAADVRTAVRVAQAAGHRDLVAMRFQEREMRGLVRGAHRGHLRRVFEDDDESHQWYRHHRYTTMPVPIPRTNRARATPVSSGC